MSGFCATCGDFILRPNVHRCPPRWIVEAIGDEDSRKTVYGLDAAEAAEKWAARYNEDDDGSYDTSGKWTVEVRREGSEDPSVRFFVTSEPAIHYHVTEVER